LLLLLDGFFAQVFHATDNDKVFHQAPIGGGPGILLWNVVGSGSTHGT
jgi:hypothetical protein